MTQTAAIWLVIAAAFAAANLPFLSERWLIAGPRVKGGPKPFGMRLVELVLMYFIVGALALLIEQRAGQIAPQNWEFYAVTGALFVTLSFPGFVYRYLVRRKGAVVAEEA